MRSKSINTARGTPQDRRTCGSHVRPGSPPAAAMPRGVAARGSVATLASRAPSICRAGEIDDGAPGAAQTTRAAELWLPFQIGARLSQRHARACRGHPRLAFDLMTKKDVDGRNKSGHDDVDKLRPATGIDHNDGLFIATPAAQFHRSPASCAGDRDPDRAAAALCDRAVLPFRRSGLDADALAPADRRAGGAPRGADHRDGAGFAAHGRHSEDGRFCTHHGVDFQEIREAIEDAEDFDDLRGGSTITQQVAKNLFLWPGRSVVRKVLEFPLALWIDLVLPKRRVLEIYLNIAEWGPNGQFGAEAARASPSASRRARSTRARPR